MVTKSQRWNLYWVESDGIEDCFVVAKNTRSARRIEIEMNGFEPDEVRATKITSIPEKTRASYEKRKKHAWPWYVYGKPFFRSLGAQFRIIDKKEEMLLLDVVYEVEEYIPCSIYRRRSIGKKAFAEMKNMPEFAAVEHDQRDDVWKEPEVPLITMLGMCLASCQKIEFYIANAFLLGISKKQKQRYRTLDDLRKGWERKTLGNMLRSIEEAWEIEPIFKANFELFLVHRNLLIHGLTTHPQYDIKTYWGRQELLSFLAFFDVHSRVIKATFRAAFHASLEFGIHFFGRPKKVPENFLSPRHREEAGMFFEVFKPKDGCI